MRRALVIGIALGGLVCSAAPAQAGTFGPSPDEPIVTDGPVIERRPTLAFDAYLGERNDVRVSGDESTSFVAEDLGAPLTPGEGCVSEGVYRVRCALGADRVSVFLGDQDDRLRLGIRGGSGFGDAGDDVLVGSPYDDELKGGNGDDVIRGREGSDDLAGEESGFFRTKRPIDNGSNLGSPGHDVLFGGPGSDSIDGGRGRDRLSGGGGDDLLDGDFSAVQAGDRRFRARDRVRGGSGRDHLIYDFLGVISGLRPPPAPALAISFDGRANDGPRGEGDNVAADVERAYSLTTARIFMDETGRVRVERANGLDGKPLKGRLGARIYRLRARGTRGAQNALFEGAEFAVRDRRRANAPLEVDLTGGAFDRCAGSTTAEASGRRRGSLIRRLLARVRGLFRVNARYVSLTVHGTAFAITERCFETRIRVTDGVVEIRSHGRRRLLGKGETFVARAR